MYENSEGEDRCRHQQQRHLERHGHQQHQQHHHRHHLRHHHRYHRERGLETCCVSSPRYGKFFFYIISNYRLLSNMPGSHTTTSTMSTNTMTTTTSSTSGSSSCEGSMSGRKGRGRRMGLEMRLVSSPWFFFFFFIFSHYTDSSLHLYLRLPLPVMPPIRNHEKGPKRCETRRLGLMWVFLYIFVFFPSY